MLKTTLTGGGTASSLMGNRKFNELPTLEIYTKLKNVLDLNNRFDELIEREEAEREVIGKKKWNNSINHFVPNAGHKERVQLNETASATPQAKALDGAYGGFQPKPAVEIIIIAMKTIEEKTYVDQAMSNMHGCTWLDDCRIPYESNDFEKAKRKNESFKNADTQESTTFKGVGSGDVYIKGRFSANMLCEDNVLDDGRITKSTGGRGVRTETNVFKGAEGRKHFHCGDTGDFSRYFSLDAWFAERIKQLPKEAQKTFPWLIVPKASKSEKNRGLEDMVDKEIYTKGHGNHEEDDVTKRFRTITKNSHATVKPIKLMSWLITLGTREGEIVLDPFVGSGTTCIAAKMLGRQCIGIEREEEYVEIARKRLSAIPRNLDEW